MNKDTPSRERAWLDAWIAVARSSNSTKHQTATVWADACLSAFDLRFPPQKESEA